MAGYHEALDRLVVDALADALEGRPETFAQNVTVGTFYPRNDKPESRKLPFVGVAWDSTVNLPGWNTGKVQVRGIVRVTIQATQPTPAKRLALLTEGLALEIVNENITKIRSNTGVFVTNDPSNDNSLASFTLRVSARLTQIA